MEQHHQHKTVHLAEEEKIWLLKVKEDRIMSTKFSHVLLTTKCLRLIRPMRLTEICSGTSRDGLSSLSS